MPKPMYLTASQVKAMMTKGRGKDKQWGDISLNLAHKIALERIGVEIDDNFRSNATDWGNNLERQAIEAYEMEEMIEVHSQQEFQQHPRFEYVGGTPDGLIGEIGGMDAKCPFNSINHMKNILNNEQLKEYKYQFQAYMWITGRKWWDFISFDPRFPTELQLHVFRVLRDEELISEIELRYIEFEEIIKSCVDSLLEKIPLHI